MTRRNESILWLLLLLVAALLRLAPIGGSLPYIDYVDEGYPLQQAIHILNRRTLDTGWYGYPSLPAYLTAAAFMAWNPVYRNVHGHSFRNDLPREADPRMTAGYNYDLIAPPELIVAGRLVAVALSIGTVALAGAIAFKMRGRLAGLLAMLIAGVCPALVLRGSNLITDTFATFFVLLTLSLCEQLRLNKARIAALAGTAGLAAGLAFASKYTAGAVFVPVLAGIWMLPKTKRVRLRLVVGATAGLFLGILAGAPATIFHWRSVVRDVAVLAGNYRIIDSKPGYFGQAVAGLELGWFVALAGCVGLVLMLRQKSTRPAVVGWCLLAATLLAPLLGKPFQPFRNVLPLVPLFCIAAAIAFAALINWARLESHSTLRGPATIVLVGAAVISTGLGSLRPLQHRMTHRDSRLQAIDWLQHQTTGRQRVLGVRELAILPAEWKRLTAATTVVSWCEALELLEREQFDFVVTGDFDPRHLPDPSAASVCLARWKEKQAALTATAEFGSGPAFIVPYLWHTNDERVVILRANNTKSD